MGKSRYRGRESQHLPSVVVVQSEEERSQESLKERIVSLHICFNFVQVLNISPDTSPNISPNKGLCVNIKGHFGGNIKGYFGVANGGNIKGMDLNLA